MIKIKKGDIVDIVAPASFSDGSELIKAIDQIKKWGLVPRTFIDFTAFHPYHSDEDLERFTDLKRALVAPDSKIIWSLRGGYGSARLLNQLSKLKKPKKEKILIGYSDITSLHLFLNQNWGWESMHGPMISSFSNKEFSKLCLSELRDVLFSNKKIHLELEPLNQIAESNKTKIEAKLVGGNMAVIQSLIGTKFSLKVKDKILVLEDVNERGYKIDRMLTHLEMSGALKGCKAIIFGDFTKGLEPDGESYVDFALTRFAIDQKIPVYKTHEFGHGKINRPLILNFKYKIQKSILKM